MVSRVREMVPNQIKEIALCFTLAQTKNLKLIKTA